MLQSLFVFNYFLEEAVGEGLPCFPGYIHWICDEMTPCYELMMLVLPLCLTHEPYASHTSSVPFPVFSAHHRPSLCSLTHHLSSLCLISFVCTHNLPLSTITYPLLSSVQFSRSVVSYSLRPHKSQHARPPCPSPTPGVHSDSCPSSQWCHPAISSCVGLFSSCPESLPASESFPMSQLFAWGGQSTGVSALASFLPKKSQGWSPSEWTGWTSLQSKGLSTVFSNTTLQRHQFFGAQPSSQSNSHIHTWPLEKP